MTPSAVGVVVPARNEEGAIEGCLASIERATAVLARWGIPTFVVVAGDSCTDRTVELAAEHLRGRRGTVIRLDAHNVGAARQAGMARLLRRFAALSPRRLWLASTDADTVVPRQWLARQVRLAAAGWDAVAGIVAVEGWEGEHPDGRRRFERAYDRRIGRLEHGHVHAANLGLRASAYLAAGGFRPRRCGEDHDLWSRLDHPRLRRLRDPGLRVTTSARLDGRAAGGFSRDLAALDAGRGVSPNVAGRVAGAAPTPGAGTCPHRELVVSDKTRG